jgi:hypothetical protein
MNGDGVPVICKNREGNLIHSVFREHIPGDLYADPLGEPYKGVSTFIQTPMADPVRPRTADELLRERMKNTGRTPLIDSE